MMHFRHARNNFHSPRNKRSGRRLRVQPSQGGVVPVSSGSLPLMVRPGAAFHQSGHAGPLSLSRPPYTVERSRAGIQFSPALFFAKQLVTRRPALAGAGVGRRMWPSTERARATGRCFLKPVAGRPTKKLGDWLRADALPFYWNERSWVGGADSAPFLNGFPRP